ncbi:MAG: hypothetical protein ACLTDS_01045 [Bianqueaceae bacterium]
MSIVSNPMSFSALLLGMTCHSRELFPNTTGRQSPMASCAISMRMRSTSGSYR